MIKSLDMTEIFKGRHAMAMGVMVKRLFVHSYGCQMNVRDLEEVTGLLLERGYRLTDCQETADVILYNTCAVREHAEDRVLSNVGRLKHLKARRPDLVIGLMGCMVQARRQELFERLPHLDFIAGPAQLYEIPDLIETIWEERKPMAAIQQKSRQEFQTISYHAGKVSALVTVMEGCDKVCSYCIVPYTRGPEVSRPLNQVVGEVRRLAERGYREVVLLGQNVNSYGRRFPGEHGVARHPVGFADLLKAVNGVEGIERIRFITSHPWDAAESLFQAMRDLEHVCEHLHLPVQSGSNRILERMRRGYTVEEYLRKLELLRAMVPGVAVTTDLMVGFPGETDEDFQATVRLVEEAQFDSAFVFAYSPRPFTLASRWTDDVADALKQKRLHTLLALQEKITQTHSQRYLGQTVEILVEEPGMGRTRTNRKVYFETADTRSNALGQLISVRVDGIRGQSLLGKMV